VRQSLREIIGTMYRYLKGGGSILVLHENPAFLDNIEFFRWLKSKDIDAYFNFRHNSIGLQAWRVSSGVRLVIPWVQDPVRERSLQLYDQLQNALIYYQQRGAPSLFSIADLSIGAKSHFYPLLSNSQRSELCVPRFRMLAPDTSFEELQEFVGCPFIVREDWLHQAPMRLISNKIEFERLDINVFRVPLAVEYISAEQESGLYYKDRVVVVGNEAFPRHRVQSATWSVQPQDRIKNESTLNEEISFMKSECPHADLFIEIARLANAPVAAFDYIHNIDGKLVIWELNPFPSIWASFNAEDQYFDYQREIVDRIYTAQLHLYLNALYEAQSLQMV
jgi:hypothetical protein